MFPLEQPYWAGEHPAVDPEEGEEYAFPFHPLALGEAALNALFGYQIERAPISIAYDHYDIPLMRYQRVQIRLKYLRTLFGS